MAEEALSVGKLNSKWPTNLTTCTSTEKLTSTSNSAIAEHDLSGMIVQMYGHGNTLSFKLGANNSRQCIVCEKTFAKAAYLKLHTRVHTGERPFPCDTCDKRFYDQAGLHRHQLIHKGLKPYKCSSCDKRFRQRCDMKKHEIQHMDKNEIEHATDLFKCNLCSSAFKYMASLKSHTRTSHLKNFNCQYCERVLSSPAALTIHTRLHTGDRPYKCPCCPKTFTNSYQLKGHSFSHTGGVKPVECDLCDKTFISQSRMKTHRTVHDPTAPKRKQSTKKQIRPKKPHPKIDKVFVCVQCGQSFLLQLSMKVHQELMHSGKEPAPSGDKVLKSRKDNLRDTDGPQAREVPKEDHSPLPVGRMEKTVVCADDDDTGTTTTENMGKDRLAQTCNNNALG